jgi:hypothetical protein
MIVAVLLTQLPPVGCFGYRNVALDFPGLVKFRLGIDGSAPPSSSTSPRLV